MIDDALHPSYRQAVFCPWCGLQTVSADTCDMCRRPIRSSPLAIHSQAVDVRAIDFSRFLGPIGLVAAIGLGVVLIMQFIQVGRKAAEPRTLPPVKSASQLPPLEQLRQSVGGYADTARTTEKTEGEPAAQGDDSLRAEKDALLELAAQRFGGGGGAPASGGTGAPATPTVASMASGTSVVVPAGDPPPEAAGLPDAAYIESVDATTSGPDFAGRVVIVNPTDREIETFDLTLQVGDRIFPVALAGQAKDPLRRGIAGKQAVAVEGSVPVLGPSFGVRRLILRVLYLDRQDPNTSVFDLP